eukprot:CAMPEP_0114524626 /NCGR_PEP_ID=MMETSP0109-20121206/21962_1 /TAXON_ID=29199 /ORGANISM="Chlorarachnion reptans, Strain CCCM449" /LENGTH=310 /DNA_ID=CAMNT_0001706095 /DNA_START=110 /DNA_END=1042 /DNA_ORIENTATION=-
MCPILGRLPSLILIPLLAPSAALPAVRTAAAAGMASTTMSMLRSGRTTPQRLAALARRGGAIDRVPRRSVLFELRGNGYSRAPIYTDRQTSRLMPIHARGFGSDDSSESHKSVRIMSTVELKQEILSYGLDHDDCEDRTDLERKLTAVRRGTYREGKIKTSEDAGGYLRAQRSQSSQFESAVGQSQEQKANSFDAAMKESVQGQRAQSFDDAIRNRLESMQEKGQKVFDLLDYPCEHEIKIVGAKQNKIDSKVRTIVGDTTGTDPDQLKTSSREKGKWVSVSVLAPVSSSDMLYDIYSRLHDEKTFRFVI